ncbi:hypothetical protein SCP_0405040 [Sparassis crispa]|uniref:Secreted protein n=1 Tax=Sparassis crispa TaxID=139825 RepID=A0A401GIU5_9APHY|nr:hypothetical protein SCP_0405040 [Sparassis crispa]GBE82124.1 hypothetical protein SCP_0405040 [Sparassis crispa]
MQAANTYLHLCSLLVVFWAASSTVSAVSVPVGSDGLFPRGRLLNSPGNGVIDDNQSAGLPMAWQRHPKRFYDGQ